MDFNKTALTAKRLIDKYGREVSFAKLDAGPLDAAKPWRGAGVVTPQGLVQCKAVFAIGNTSIPTESRGLAFDWVDRELLRTTHHVCIVAAAGLTEVLDDYKIMYDGTDSKTWRILWGQCLQPSTVRLLYVFGLKE